MYLWKYWRESRITFAVGLALVGLLLWSLLKLPVGYPGRGVVGYSQNGVALNPAQPIPPQIYLVITSILTLPLAFLGLRFGSFGVGRDLGEGSGSFLFSRPRKRAFFVWSDWTYGMAQLLLLVLAANAVLAFGYYRIAPESGPALISGEPISMASIFVLHCLAGLLLTGLIFGLTYFISVVVKSRGVLLTVGAIVAYLVVKQVVKHYWPDITLPDLTLSEFSMSHSMIVGFARNLGLSIALRTALALAFPVAAQLLLQQRDID
jgi:hypothetical protein